MARIKEPPLHRFARKVLCEWLRQDGPAGRWLLRRSVTVRKVAFWLTVAVYPAFCLLSWLRLGVRRLLGLKPTVLWAPTPILTIAESSEVLRRRGYKSTTLVFTTYYITSRFDLNLKSLIYNEAVGFWVPNPLFLWSLLRFDVYHFFFDGGLWSGMKIVPEAKWLELPLLRLAGKRIIASAYGSDVRVKALAERRVNYNLCKECPEPGKYCICVEASAAANAKYYRDWCNELLAMGDMNEYVEGSRLDVNYWPVDVASIDNRGDTWRGGTVRVVHSPNHQHFKGTRFIRQAVDALRAKGYDVELTLVEGVSNVEARRMYGEADIVVAQCIAGWTGYTEIEAMAAGKPVVTYLRDERYLAHSPNCPLVSASPDDLEQELERLVRSRELRRELGERGRAWVEREWSYEALAPQYDELHQRVWRRNRLFQTLWRKCKDVRLGESGYRAARPRRRTALGKWSVYGDCRVGRRKFDSGVFSQPPYDEESLPLYQHTDNRHYDHPGLVAWYGLQVFGAASDWQERFLGSARRLREQLVVDAGGTGRWYHEFPLAGRDLGSRWVSASSQSLGVSNLLRAEQLLPGAGFGESARAAARVLWTPVERGGVLCESAEEVFLEEFPEGSPSHHLGGCLVGLAGLFEYWQVTADAASKELFDRGVRSLRRALPEDPSELAVSGALVVGAVPIPDYPYFLARLMSAVGALAMDKALVGDARALSRGLLRGRVNGFLTGKAPL